MIIIKLILVTGNCASRIIPNSSTKTVIHPAFVVADAVVPIDAVVAGADDVVAGDDVAADKIDGSDVAEAIVVALIFLIADIVLSGVRHILMHRRRYFLSLLFKFVLYNLGK